MEILIALFKYFPYGGLQSDARRIAEEAMRQGHDVTVLTTSWKEAERPAGLKVKEVPVRGLTNTARMKAFAEDFRRMVAARREHGDADGSARRVVTLSMNRLPGADFYFAGDACLKARLPQKSLWCVKSFLPRYRAVLKQEASVFSASSKTRYLLISERQKREFGEHYPAVSADRFVLLPPGIDERAHRHAISAELRSELRRECGAGDGDVLLMTVGTNLKLKGVARTLSVLGGLPANVCYAVIGNDHPEAFDALRKRHGVPAERVRFLGPKRNVPDYLCAADLMVHAAMEEGAGSVLLEAVSCGLPVVCTEVCGFSPFIGEIDGDCLVREPYSPEKLATTIERALAHLVELKTMTKDYALQHDFTTRAKRVVELLTTGGTA